MRNQEFESLSVGCGICGGGGQGGDDAAGLELDREEVHLLQLVVDCTAVGHSVDVVNVEVGVVVLLEFLGHAEGGVALALLQLG